MEVVWLLHEQIFVAIWGCFGIKMPLYLYRLPIMIIKCIIFIPECMIPGRTVFELKGTLAPERTWWGNGGGSALLTLCEGNPHMLSDFYFEWKSVCKMSHKQVSFFKQLTILWLRSVVPEIHANELSSVVWNPCLSPNWPIDWPTQKQSWRSLHDHLP